MTTLTKTKSKTLASILLITIFAISALGMTIPIQTVHAQSSVGKATIYYTSSDATAATTLATHTGFAKQLWSSGMPPVGSIIVGGPHAYGLPAWFAPNSYNATTIIENDNICPHNDYTLSNYGGFYFVWGLSAANTATIANSFPVCPSGGGSGSVIYYTSGDATAASTLATNTGYSKQLWSSGQPPTGSIVIGGPHAYGLPSWFVPSAWTATQITAADNVCPGTPYYIGYYGPSTTYNGLTFLWGLSTANTQSIAASWPNCPTSSTSGTTITTAEQGIVNYLAGLTGKCNFGSSYCAPSEYYDLPISVTWASPTEYGMIGYTTMSNSQMCEVANGGGTFNEVTSTPIDGEYNTTENLVFYYGAAQTCNQALTLKASANWDYSSTQIEVCVMITTTTAPYFSPYPATITLGSSVIVTNPSTLTDYCVIDHSHVSINGQNIPNGNFDSFRYTYRHGTMFGADLYLAGTSTANGFGQSTNGFASLLSSASVTYPNDIYSPLWYFTPTAAASGDYGLANYFAYTASAYYDCSISSPYQSNYEYPYSSKVCSIGTTAYILLSEDAALNPTLVALQTLANGYSPTYNVGFNMCSSGPLEGGSCYTANQVANYDLNTFGVYSSGGSFVGIEGCLNIVLKSISCYGTPIAEGVTTATYAELVTMLYSEGENNYSAIAETTISSILASQQTGATFVGNNGNTYYRPLNTGSIFVGWDGNNFAPPQGFLNSFEDWFNMPNEYGGFGSTIQEVNFASLAALCTYNYLINHIINACA